MLFAVSTLAACQSPTSQRTDRVTLTRCGNYEITLLPAAAAGIGELPGHEIAILQVMLAQVKETPLERTWQGQQLESVVNRFKV